jgi:hypothetical protein
MKVFELKKYIEKMDDMADVTFHIDLGNLKVSHTSFWKDDPKNKYAILNAKPEEASDFSITLKGI